MSKKNSASYENNLRYENGDLNNRISEDNNNCKNSGSNYNIFTFGRNSLNPNEKTQIRINKNMTNNLKPPQVSDYQYPELIDIEAMENQYNTYINELKKKLFEAKNERRKKEEEAMQIQHRLTVLKNHEQSKLVEFEKVKEQIGKIINNRFKAEENMKIKLEERKYFKKSIGPWGKTPSPPIKKNKTMRNFLNKRRKNKFMHNSQKDFYRPKKFNNFSLEQNNEKINDNYNFSNIANKNKSIDLNNIDLNMFKSLSKSGINDKKLFKMQLIEKLKQDEEEKKKIESEIAKIEEEENKILNQINNVNNVQ